MNEGGPTHPAHRFKLLLAFAAIYLIWGSTYLAIRVAVETFPPFMMAAFRFLIAGTALFAFVRARGFPWPSARQWRDQAVVGIFLLLGGNAVVSWSEQRVPSGVTTLILGASPLSMVVLEWLRPGGRRPTIGLLAGLGIGIAGLCLLLGRDAIPAGNRPPAACVLALLLASVSWWIGSIYSKHAPTQTATLPASAMQMLLGGVAVLVTGLWVGEGSRLQVAAISGPSWAAFSYLVVVGSLLAFPVYGWLLENSTPAKVSTFAYVNPVIAVILGWAILNEPLTLRMAVAAAIIVGAVALITVQKTRSSEAGS